MENLETNIEEQTPLKPKWKFKKKEWVLTLLFAFIFFFSGTVVYEYSVHEPEQTKIYYSKVKDIVLGDVKPEDNTIAELNKEHPRSDVWKMQLKDTGKIFLNNIRVTLIVLVGSLLTVYFYPTVAMIGNGAVLGLVLGATKLFTPESHPLEVFVTSILPHGILELPAIFFACVVGARWGKSLYQTITRKEVEYTFWETSKQTFWFTVKVLLPMLVVAAFIEMFVTPHLMN